MVIAFWYFQNRNAITDEFMVCMIRFGGCFPTSMSTSAGRTAQFDTGVAVMAPAQNYVQMLRRSAQIPAVLILPPPARCTAAQYLQYHAACTKPSAAQREETYKAFEQILQLPPPTGRPGPFRVSYQYLSRTAEPSSWTPDHPIFESRTAVEGWYTTPSITQISRAPLSPTLMSSTTQPGWPYSPMCPISIWAPSANHPLHHRH
jgi:hypothetical protein